MLRKVHISEPERKSSTILENVRCPICEEVSTKSVMRVANSADVIRNACQRDLAILTRENGDYIACLDQDSSNMRVTRCEASSLPSKHFASGDHGHCFKCFRAIPKSKSLNRIEATENPIIGRIGRFSVSDEEVKGEHKKTVEATIKYKNVNFRESDSLLSFCGVKEKETINSNPEKIVGVIHRPITCPVTECRKIIARASVLQHFYFDHSKIPRISLSVSKLQRVFIKLSAITKKIRCFAIFLLENDARAPLIHTAYSDTLMNGGYKNASFLLMGVRVASAETIKKSRGDCPIRHVQTQTEAQAESLKALTNKDMNAAERYMIQYHGAIILWIIKLAENTSYYNISIRSPDKNLGYSFTGNALNIGEFLDLQDIYDQVECLRILEKATYKLVNEQNELEVTVNILKKSI